MKKKSKIILGGCIVVAALIGLSVWNAWFSATKIAFVNFQTNTAGKHLESQRQFIHQTQRSVS